MHWSLVGHPGLKWIVHDTILTLCGRTRIPKQREQDGTWIHNNWYTHTYSISRQRKANWIRGMLDTGLRQRLVLSSYRFRSRQRVEKLFTQKKIWVYHEDEIEVFIVEISEETQIQSILHLSYHGWSKHGRPRIVRSESLVSCSYEICHVVKNL